MKQKYIFTPALDSLSFIAMDLFVFSLWQLIVWSLAMLFIPCKHLCNILILMLYFQYYLINSFFFLKSHVLGHCHLGIAFFFFASQVVIFEPFQHVLFFCFVFLKKNNKKAPLAHLITCVVERPELDVPDVTFCVSSLECAVLVLAGSSDTRWCDTDKT